MISWTDAIIVTLIAIGASVLVGFLGYLIDKNERQEGNEQK